MIPRTIVCIIALTAALSWHGEARAACPTHERINAILRFQEAKEPLRGLGTNLSMRDAECGRRRLIETMRGRGETSLAAFEEQRLGTKYQSSRGDLSIDQAASTVARSMKQDDMATRIRVFNRVLDTSGKGQTIDFYDKVVLPFVQHLAIEGQVPAALQGQMLLDVTFDPTSSLERQADPEAIQNFRNPLLELDNMYGSGPRLLTSTRRCSS